MELGYNADIGTGATAAYNGNIKRRNVEHNLGDGGAQTARV